MGPTIEIEELEDGPLFESVSREAAVGGSSLAGERRRAATGCGGSRESVWSFWNLPFLLAKALEVARRGRFCEIVVVGGGGDGTGSKRSCLPVTSPDCCADAMVSALAVDIRGDAAGDSNSA